MKRRAIPEGRRGDRRGSLAGEGAIEKSPRAEREKERRKGRIEALPTFTAGVATRVHVSRYLPLHLRANLTATNRRPRSRKWVANRRIGIYCAIKRPSLRLPSRFRIEANFTPKACGGDLSNIFTRPDPRRLIYFARASLSSDSARKREGKCRLSLIYLAYRETQTTFG